MNREVIKKQIKESLEKAITRRYIKELVTEELLKQMNENDNLEKERTFIKQNIDNPVIKQSQLIYKVTGAKTDSEKNKDRSLYSKKFREKHGETLTDDDVKEFYPIVKKLVGG